MPEHLPPRWRKYYLKKFPLFIRRADHIVTVSEFSKRDLMERAWTYPPKKYPWCITIPPKGSVPPRTKAVQRIRQRNMPKANRIFLFVGLIHPRKNILAWLIEAFTLLKRTERAAAASKLAGCWRQKMVDGGTGKNNTRKIPPPPTFILLGQPRRRRPAGSLPRRLGLGVSVVF